MTMPDNQSELIGTRLPDNAPGARTFESMSRSVCAFLRAFADARIARKQAVATRAERMAAWQAWAAAQHASIDAQYAKAEASLCEGLPSISALLTDEQDKEAAAKAVYLAAVALLHKLRMQGLELPDIPTPENMSCALGFSAQVVDAELLPASVLTPSKDLLRKALLQGEVPGATKQTTVSFTVRDPK
jgi:hypothetical protein